MDIIFPLHTDEIRAHANRGMLVDIAFRSSHDVEIHCFDPMDLEFFNLHHFMQCIFNWATFAGFRPISMIGGYMDRGYDLDDDFQAWILDNFEIDETVTATS